MHAQLGISHLHATHQLFHFIWKRVEVVALAFKGEHRVLFLGRCGGGHDLLSDGLILPGFSSLSESGWSVEESG